MPQAARLGDPTTGHPPYPPQVIVSGSGNVLINGIPAARQADPVTVHCSPIDCHPGVIAQGCPTVFVNGIPAARVADPVSCGPNVIASGSGNVIIGG